MNTRTTKFDLILLTVITIISLSLRFSVLTRQGEMFDEVAVVRSGQIYLGGIKNLDFSNSIWQINKEHPPVAKYIFGLGGVVEKKIPWIQKTFDSEYHVDKGYFLSRIISSIIGTLTILIVFFIGKEWFNRTVGFTAGIILALMPHFIAHNAVAGLETPLVLFSTLLVYFYVKGIRQNSLKLLLLSFAFFSLLVLTKFNGLFFVFFYLAALFLTKKNPFKDKFVWKSHVFGVFVFLLLLYVLWPWLWQNPLNILKSFGYYKNAHIGEYFLGSIDQPPWYYHPMYFLATTPPFYLLLVGIAILYFLANVRSNDHKGLYLNLTILWFLTPFTISILGIKQDGIRHVFSYLAPLGLLCGYGFYMFWKNLRGICVKGFVLLLGFGSVFWSLYRFFPYYLDYYNVLIGGTENVYKNKLMDFAWWGEGIKESVLYVNNNYDDISVWPIFNPSHVAPLFKEGIMVQNGPASEPDLILISEDFYYYDKNLPNLENYIIEHQVTVVGYPLVRIYRKI